MNAKRSPKSESSTWQLQEAKARLSEVVRRAIDEGPQRVSLRGEPAVVIVSETEYRALKAKRRSIVDHILEGPRWPDDLVEAINDRAGGDDRDIAF